MKFKRHTRDRAYYRYVRRKAIRRRKFINDHVYLNEHGYYVHDGQYGKGKIPRRHKGRSDREDRMQKIIEVQQMGEVV